MPPCAYGQRMSTSTTDLPVPGDAAQLEAAIAARFEDHTLPAGRPQGPEGPAFASRQFRAAVPDLRCEVEELVVAGEKVTARLRFRGTFTGTFANRSGSGQPVDFIAIDVLGFHDGKVTDNWHLEDNLTLMQQLGVVADYTVHMNDIASFDFAGFSPADYEQQLRDEFEQLYEEGATRRRMMSISLHDRISGHASRVRVLDRFLTWARERPDVWWARRDEIADWALATPELMPTVERATAEVRGLPGDSSTPPGSSYAGAER
jgi:predicted ester cyclase